MDVLAAQPRSERQALFVETAARMGASAVVSEKDFWVCFALHHLFAIDFRPALLFKGGTSLSKAFGLIERFSEDIDLTLNRAELGFAGADDPLEISGRKARQRKIEALAERCGRVVHGELEPALRASFERVLGKEGWSLESVPREDGQVDLHFRYPPALEPDDYGGLGYIQPLVRMEIGARSDQEPSVLVSVRCYAADHFPDVFVKPETEVRVLAPERTFWEKATIFHAENHRPATSSPPRAWRQLSRHAYDLVMMDRRGVADRALARLDLLEAVARHKDAFFYTGWANYEAAASPATLRLAPGEALRSALRRDYADMAPMLFGEVPTFDELLAGLGALEDRVRGLRG